MAAPGLVDTLAAGAAPRRAIRRCASCMLGLGADKGLHGVGLFVSQPSSIISKAAIRHLADFKGKKVRVFASQFQTRSLWHASALTPVAMTLGRRVAGAAAGRHRRRASPAPSSITPMHYQDAAKYVTNIGQPVIFGLAAVSKKWYDGAAAGFATDRRQGRRRGDGRSRSADRGDRCARRQRLGGERRRIDRPAA